MRRIRSKSRVFPSLFAVFAMLWISVVPSAVSAQQVTNEEVFVVREISVDETAESTSAARMQALAKGQITAAQRLMDRLTRPLDRSALAPLDAETVRTLVASFQIDNEKTSNVRYLADMTVSFKPAAVRRFLQTFGVPFAEVRSRPVLIVPALARETGYILWEEPNPWREAWQNHPSAEGLVPVVSPVGDLADITGLSAEQAVDADVGALHDAATRYGAGTAMVAIASLDQSTPGGERIDITLIRVGRSDELPLLISLQILADEPLEAFLGRAVSLVIEALNTEWKNENIFTSGQSGRLRAAVPVSDLKSWVEIQRRLSRAPNVSAVHVLALTANSAEIEIDYRGDTDRLERALLRSDLLLEPSGFGDPSAETGLTPSEVILPTHVLRLAGF